MSDFFVKHKDKIVTSVISVIISGIVSASIGYFYARIGLENRISKLEADYANTLRTIAQITKDIDVLESKQDSLGSLPDRIDLLKDRVDAYSAQTDIIRDLAELHRNRTINELEDLLKKHGRFDLLTPTQ